MNTAHPRTVLAAILAAGLSTANLALADSELWVGNPGVTATTNWSDTANWSGTSHSPNNNTLFFDNGVAVGTQGQVNNVVDLSINCYALDYTNSTGFHTTFIADGQTLTISGNNSGPALTLIPGAQASPINTIIGTNGLLLITGGSAGGITVTTTNSGGTGIHPTLDLSGLGTLIMTNTTGAAAINVGNNASRPGGTLLLAMTNILALPATGTGGSAALVVGEATSNNGSSPGGVLDLGITNAIFAGNIGVGLSKQSVATIQFNPAFLANNPVVYLRGPGGSAVTNWAIGDGINTSGTSTSPGGTVNLNGGTVNAVVNSMWLGKPSQTSATAPSAKGTLSFNAGTFTVVNLTNACGVAHTTGGAGTSTGTINVAGTGTLAVSNLVLALLPSGALASTGTLNATNGTIAAGTIVAAGGNSSLNLAGGTLYLTNTAGVMGQPLTLLYASNSTMQLTISGSAAPIVVTTLNVDGTTNVMNFASIPAIGLYPAQFPVISYGGLTGSFNFGLGTLPGSYQGYISNNTDNASVDLVITGSALKTDTWNGNVSGNWDTTTLNWVSGGNHVAYQQGDFVTLDDTLTGTANVVLATNLVPGAIGFNNSTNNYVLSGAFKITGVTSLAKQGSGSVTLSETGGDDFSGGITVGAGTLILDNANSAISGGLAVNSGTVQVGNNDTSGALPSGSVVLNDSSVLVFDRTDSISVGTAIAGVGSLTQNGSGTVALTGANAYTGNTTANAGTLALSGSGTLVSSAGVTVNSAAFDVSALSQPAPLQSLTLNGANIAVSLSVGMSANITCGNLTYGAAASHINVLSLPAIASYPVTFTIIQSTNGASGTFNVAPGTFPAATPAYGATVAPNGDNTAVLLTIANGPTGVRSGVFWVGTDAPANFNWSDGANWLLPGAPGAGENVFFTPVAAQNAPAISPTGGGINSLNMGNVNNIVDANFTISSLTYTNADGSFHNAFINDGLTLDMTNTLTIGSTSLDFGSGATETVSFAGTNGTVAVNNTNATVFVGLGSGTTGSHWATLDMSALGTFNANISRMMMGVGSGSCGIPLARQSAIVYLAQTNIIVASLAVSGTETSDTSASAVAFGIGDNDGNNGSASYLYLGQTNAIFADAIGVSRQKQDANMLFNTAFTLPSAYFRGRSGGSVTTWSQGDGVVNGGGAVGPTGTADFTGGVVDALISTMYVGRGANNGSGSGTSTGTLTFDGGLFDVTTLYAGYQPTNAAKTGTGTINVNSNSTAGLGATLRVRGNLNLGVSVGGSTANGTLNIANGAVQAFNIVPGLNSTISVAGGTLVLTNPLGSATSPLATLSLAPVAGSGQSATLLCLPVRTNAAGITVTTLNLDEQDSTTNIINVESVGPVGATPVELPLIHYGTLNPVSGSTFNVGLGTLPSGYAGYLVNDTVNNNIALMLTSALHPVPRITSLSVTSGTNVVLGGVNGFANVTYSVVTSTNVALPLASWTQAGTGIFAPDGSFNFSARVSASDQQFFRLRAP
ncbi:MAG TPA: autotransporter-associated beta strand repeat-containing protein [Candidatus Acidoferrum sp.]|nr:autotransporter-associated beta strand repeat-containing protein [Candidatus Acidoferrum sp.]